VSGPVRDKNGNLQNITKWPRCTHQRPARESQLAYCQRTVGVPMELPTIGRSPCHTRKRPMLNALLTVQ